MSTLPLTKSFNRRKLESLSYQALGACFKPYNALSSLKIKFGCMWSTKLGVCSTYTSSSIKPFKNALFENHLEGEWIGDNANLLN